MAFWLPFGMNFSVLFLSFISVWIWQLNSKNAGVIDALWGICFPVQAITYFYFAGNYTFKNIIILCLLCFWGLRLGIYLALRNIGKPEDKRYTQIRKDAGNQANAKILSFYLIQFFFAIILFLPIYYIFKNPTSSFHLFDYLGILILLIAVLFEAIADEQLRRFKSKPENKGKVFDKGLWYFSRHPNYFFEWLAWVSIFILSLSIPFGFLSIFSALIMYLLLTKGTGISMTEATIMSTKKDEYSRYIESTSAFFPWRKIK